MRLLIAVAFILLLVAACGGGSVPTAVVPGTSTSVPPTSTVAQDGSGGVSGLTAYCEEVSALAEERATADAATWGEVGQEAAKLADDLEKVGPPEELKTYHSASIALLQAIRDLSRSQDASEPFASQVYFEASEVAVKQDAAQAAAEALQETLGDETFRQMSRCFDFS